MEKPMAPDERDRSFDKALARLLRGESSSQDSANSPSRDFGRAGECPGPATLAAYHERDRSFDKALARLLRGESSSQDSANSPSRDFGRAGECPGPETLAAYHERSLLPEEMNSWKEHIVGCSNCQTVLSQLEATDELPLPPAADSAPQFT